MARLFLTSIVLAMLLPTSVVGEVFDEPPSNPDKNAIYVFYSHGFIVEGDDPRPVHPRWGVYDFPSVVSTLAQDGVDVIAYHRPSGANPKDYAHLLAEQVKGLLSSGVSANQITLVGFSRGGLITAYASNALKNTPVNTIILAACGDWVMNEADVVIHGRFFSVYETSDSVGSCEALAKRSVDKVSFEELAISTQKEHGAFYKPYAEWIEPVNERIKVWADEQN